MNINQQFPPSSPLLNSELDSEDNIINYKQDTLFENKCTASQFSLKQHNLQKENTYATPAPSSSLGNTTIISDINNDDSDVSMINDPVKEPTKTPEPELNDEPVLKKLKSSPTPILVPTFNDAINQSKFRNVINVPLNGDTFKIGRSGLSCSFKLNSSNRLISRVHAEIKYELSSNLIFLKCTGFNGLNITIPKSINVKHIKDKEYRILIKESDSSDKFNDYNELDETDDELSSNSSRVLNKNQSFTNFYMLKDEIIRMPMIEGTVLDFRGDIALLVYNIDAATTDLKNQEPRIPKRKLSISELTKIVEQKRLQFSTHPTLKEIENKKNGLLSSNPRPIEKNMLSNTIIYKRPTPITTPTLSPSKITTSINETRVDKDENKENKGAFTPSKNNKFSIARKPLADITDKHNNKILKAVHNVNSSNDLINKLTKSLATKEIKNNIKAVDAEGIGKAIKVKDAKPVKNNENHENKESSGAKSHVINVISASIDGLQKPGHTSILQSPEPKEVDEHDDNKKRGRPKKPKQTEEEILRNMPKESIDSILSTVPELNDISNLVTNHIAYSRVLQTPFSSLRELNPIKKHNLSKIQLRCILIHNIDCIGVIFRQGKDAAGKALDEEYYYIPEKDEDKQRVQLVEELKGSSSHLRSCRKTHKQYFWKKPKI